MKIFVHCMSCDSSALKCAYGCRGDDGVVLPADVPTSRGEMSGTTRVHGGGTPVLSRPPSAHLDGQAGRQAG